MPTIHLIIKGKVQGVFYRASASEMAERLQLTGWIKNTPEGHVEAVISGGDKAVQEFIRWSRQGPPRAMVTEVVVKPMADTFFTGFFITRQ